MCQYCRTPQEYMRNHSANMFGLLTGGDTMPGMNWGHGRTYRVTIEATDGIRTKTMDEFVSYPNASHGPSGCVSERDREARAVDQVKAEHPMWKNIRAVRSISAD